MKTVEVKPGILGTVFPPRADKLGKIPESSFLLHKLITGEIPTIEPDGPFDGAGFVKEWIGYKWVYLNTRHPSNI